MNKRKKKKLPAKNGRGWEERKAVDRRVVTRQPRPATGNNPLLSEALPPGRTRPGIRRGSRGHCETAFPRPLARSSTSVINSALAHGDVPPLWMHAPRETRGRGGGLVVEEGRDRP